ncbi:MAG: tetratricopeptide repeat protein [Pirellulaceae bacterium]
MLLLLQALFGDAISNAQQNAEPQLTPPQRAAMIAERDRLLRTFSALDQQGRIEDAIAAAEQIIAIQRQLFGEKDPVLAGIHGWIAERQEALQQLEAALTHRRKALAILKALPQAKAVRVAGARSALAHVEKLAALTQVEMRRLADARSLYRQAAQKYGDEKPAEALVLMQRAAEEHRRTLGAEDQETLGVMADLGSLYSANGDLVQAESLLAQVVETQRKLFGEQHPAYARTLERLVNVHWKSAVRLDVDGKLVEAVATAEKALLLERQLYGDVHPKVAGGLGWIADRQDDLEHYQAAIERRGEVVSIKEKLYGSKDWRVTDARLAVEYAAKLAELPAGRRRQLTAAEAIESRAAGLFQEGKFDQVVPLATQMLQIRKNELGEKHPDYATSLNDLGHLYSAQGKYAQAEQFLRQALHIRKEALGEKHPHYATTLSNLAALYQQQGSYAQAEPLHRQSLELRRELLGEKSPEYAVSLNNLASLYQAQGKYVQAEPLCRRAVEIVQAVQGEKHPTYAKCLSNLASLLQARGKYTQAEPLYRRALEIRKQVLGEMHPDYAASLKDMGSFYVLKAEYTQAEPLYLEALKITNAVRGEGHPTYALRLNDLANLYESQGNYAQAEALCRQVLEITRKLQGEKHPDYATALYNLGWLHQVQGEYAQAEPLSRQALKIRKELLGEFHPDYADSLNNLASLSQSRGDDAQAERLYRQAMDITRKVLGERHPDFAASLSRLAALHSFRGDYTQAELLYRRAMDIEKKVFGERHPVYATSLNDLAVLYASRGDYAQAAPLCRQALTIRKEVLGEKHPAYATSLNTLADLYYHQGDYVRAESLIRRSVEIQKTMQGEMHPEYAIKLNNLAAMYEALEKYDQAESLYNQALEINKDLMRPEHPDCARILTNLALMHHSQRNYARAEPLYRRALAISLENLEAAASLQSERQQLAMTKMLRYQLNNYLALAVEAEMFELAAYRHWLAWKGMVFARQKTVRVAAAEPELKPLFDEFQSVASRLATLAFRSPEPGQRATWQQQIEELTKQKERLEAEMTQRSAAYRAARRRGTLEDVQAALQDRSALIDFVEIGKGRLLAFIVRPANDVKLLDLAATDELNEMVDAWRDGLGGGDESQEAAIRLRKMIWEPLEPLLKGTELVLVSPDGALGKLPLAALPGRESGTYLIEERRLAVVNTPQVLPELLADERAKEVTGNLLLLGGVNYDNHSNVLAANTPRKKTFPGRRAPRDDQVKFAPLEGTRGELAGIEKMYRDNFGIEGIVSLEGSAASEERLRSEAPRHLYLHLATHGFFAAERFRSALERSVTSRPLPSDLIRRQTISGYNPGLLSGLALAGANDPDPDRDDGILTAEEVQSLDLRDVDLAVLSACETGLGKAAGGEGLLGLQRSFQMAGARTVVASLWKVDDVATRDLMERFYRNMWERDMGKLEALREAQLWMLRERGPRGLKLLEDENADRRRLPPYYWAAFVLSGDWR